jgi:uncharacterized UPF0160 family protein
MDSLIKSIKKFSITNNSDEFEKSLDSVIDKMEYLKTEENCEWELLKLNYSKLRYLNHTLGKSNLTLESNKKFLFSLSRFMEYIDKTTQCYLEKVDWESQNECPDKAKIIYTHFVKSLDENDSIKKMKEILNAYAVLVPIIEDMNNDKFVETIDDEEFFHEFKKSRYNSS